MGRCKAHAAAATETYQIDRRGSEHRATQQMAHRSSFSNSLLPSRRPHRRRSIGRGGADLRRPLLAASATTLGGPLSPCRCARPGGRTWRRAAVRATRRAVGHAALPQTLRVPRDADRRPQIDPHFASPVVGAAKRPRRAAQRIAGYLTARRRRVCPLRWCDRRFRHPDRRRGAVAGISALAVAAAVAGWIAFGSEWRAVRATRVG